MTQRDNILQELNELQSSLAKAPAHNVYAVPAEYFEGLAEIMLTRVKALDASNAATELSILSPILSQASKQMPYDIPANYFQELPEAMLTTVNHANAQTAEEELKSISPLLSSLKKENLYSVPEGYFETVVSKPQAKVVSFTGRKLFRYAAAAIVIGIVATSALLVVNQRNPNKQQAKLEEKVKKEIRKASDKELNEFVALTGDSRDLAVNGSRLEMRDLLKDVSASEMQAFLEEVADPDLDNDLSSTME